MRYSLGCYYESDALQSSLSATSASKLSCFPSSTSSLFTYKRLRLMPSKSGRNGRPFLQDPFTVQLLNPSLTIKTVIHTVLNVPALLKFFYGYTSFLTCCSSCLDHYATYRVKLRHRRSDKIMSSATNFQK